MDSYREEMKDDLMRVYREVTGTYECQTNLEAFDRVVHHEAPRFYICPRRAHLIISQMVRGDRSRLEELSPLRKEMYEALFDIVVRLSGKSKFYGKSLYYILQFAVIEKAPRFYISAERMGQIWLERRRTRIRQRKELS